MNELFTAKNIADVYALRSTTASYNKIIIHTKKLKYLRLVRHVVKYAYWALQTGGQIEIIDEPSRSYLITKRFIDFWQVKLEVFRSVGPLMVTELCDDKKGHIMLTKKEATAMHTGISFGIMFSGSDTDKQLISHVLNAILANTFLQSIPFEVIVCGPTGFDPLFFDTWKQPLNLRYLPFDMPNEPGRIMICQKKNALYAQCSYSIVSITHTRILYSDSFAQTFWERQFDVCTPNVSLPEGKQYLDYALMESYDNLNGIRKKRAMGSNIFGKKYLHFLHNRVPWIDGGITVFNKHAVPLPPYHNQVAWAEAEDAVMCQKLTNDGIVIDYLYECKCVSQTSKINLKYEGLKKLVRQWLFLLNKKG